jgi:hypothetical protein
MTLVQELWHKGSGTRALVKNILKILANVGSGKYLLAQLDRAFYAL